MKKKTRKVFSKLAIFRRLSKCTTESGYKKKGYSNGEPSNLTILVKVFIFGWVTNWLLTLLSGVTGKSRGEVWYHHRSPPYQVGLNPRTMQMEAGRFLIRAWDADDPRSGITHDE